MKGSKGISMNTVLGVAAGAAVAIFLINRFTDAGLGGFGRPAPGSSAVRT
jgi:hypothetical protein